MERPTQRERSTFMVDRCFLLNKSVSVYRYVDIAAEGGERLVENARMMRVPLSVWLTLALVVISAPHTAEDFEFGAFQQRGMDPSAPAIALGATYALQVAGAFLAGRRARVGIVLLIVAGLVWTVGAVSLHAVEIVTPGPYRHGFISKALEIAIIGLGIAIAVAGGLELRRPE